MPVTLTPYTTTKRAIVTKGNTVFYEDIEMAAGSFVSLPNSSVLDTTKQVAMFEAYQKVFIANVSLLYVADFTNNKIATASIAAGGTYPRKGTVLTGATSSVTAVVDYVDATSGAATVYAYVTTPSLPVQSNEVLADALSSVSFTTSASGIASPHFYPWTTYANSSVFGTMPDDAAIGCLYRGRAVLAGNQRYPYQWYMSRAGNLYDWLYIVNDALAPVAGTDADAGEMGDVIQALISYNDDYLIIGGATTIYVLRGDPAAGGSLDQLTDTTGIFGPDAWTWDSQRNLFFWGTQGVYKLSNNFQLENISITTLPDLIRDEGANPETHKITLGYDQIREGITICVTTIATGANSNYFYDLRTQGFFPESYPAVCGAYSQLYYDANDTSLAGLLIGCTDGYVRTFDDDAKADDQGATDAAIDSYATIGPAAIGVDVDSRGRMKTMSITTGTSTDGVDYNIYVKDSAEEIVDDVESAATPFFTGSISTGNRLKQLRPRSRGAWLGMKLKNDTAEETWEFEKMIIDATPAGDIK